MAPKTDVIEYMAKLRETPESDDGSTADEDAPPRGSGWVGHGLPPFSPSPRGLDFSGLFGRPGMTDRIGLGNLIP